MSERNSLLKLNLGALAVTLLLSAFCNDTFAKPEGKGYPELFSELHMGAEQQKALKSKPEDIRQRNVNIRRDLLSELLENGEGVLKLNLFSDSVYDCHFTKSVKRADDNYTLFGEILDEPLASAALSVKGEAVTGYVRLPGRGLLRISYISNNHYEITEQDDSYFSEEDDAIIAEPSGEAFSMESERITTGADDGNEIDVMVVYTPQARDTEGGEEAIESLINLMVDATNQAYENSLINPRIRLVYQGLVDYVESGSTSIDLLYLVGDSDGHMDIVHPLRDVYGADLVCLLFDSSCFCGRSYLMSTLSSNFSELAFSVVSRNSAGYYIFAHELGHNMGCHHAVGDGDLLRGTGLYNYSHGWRWTGDSSTEYRSIMAYTPGRKVQHFSNPDVLYDGVATGRPDLEDNARTINNAAYTVSNFRQSVSSYYPPTAHDVLIDLGETTGPVTVNLSAEDEGHPIPPNALKYIIKSLPQKGLLEEPNGTPINTVPYELSNYSNEIVYISNGDYNCPDRFYYCADDSGIEPDGGVSNIASVTTNVERVIYSTDMNSEPDWSMTGDWEWGVPTGAGSHNNDPASGYTGANVVGYNLNGDYANNISNSHYATINMIDCNDFSHVTLSFYRWLGVENNYWDYANIKVSNNVIDWTIIWENPTDAISDTSWQYMEYDISSIADDQNKVYIRWGIGPTDITVTYPGWNIDDVKVTGFTEASILSGDFDLDCDVDFKDFSVLGKAWNASEGDENWNLVCDEALVQDGVIDINDLNDFIGNWLMRSD
ncbi:MAG: reprolysin-like metallopeptidase [Planctomycetota bacterium]|jgi:hypothetical protein